MKKEKDKKVTSKQIVAIGGIVLLVLMYMITLFAAIFDNSASARLFWMCLFATAAIPLLIWIYIWMYGKLKDRHTIADFDLNKNAGDDRISDESAAGDTGGN